MHGCTPRQGQEEAGTPSTEWRGPGPRGARPPPQTAADSLSYLVFPLSFAEPRDGDLEDDEVYRKKRSANDIEMEFSTACESLYLCVKTFTEISACC